MSQRWRDPHDSPGADAGQRHRRDGARRAARAGGRGARRGGPRRPAAPAARTYRVARRAAHAEGAGESGLSRLIELHAFNTAGDAAVAISLAGTLFFQVPTGEARGQVALFLGPDDAAVRDRGAADRAVPRPVQPRPPLGDRLDDGDPGVPRAGCSPARSSPSRPWLFPAALGVLVASKAYGVTRAAAVPRLLPRRAHAWSRPTPGSRWPASSASRCRPRWPGWRRRSGRSGRCATRSCCSSAATILAILLPTRVDSSAGRGRRWSSTRAEQQRGRAPQGRRPDPAAGRVRAARQLRAALAVGLPDHVHGVPAAGEPDRRLGGPARAAARRRGRRGRHRQHPRHRARRRCSSGSTPPSPWWSRCSRTRR